MPRRNKKRRGCCRRGSAAAASLPAELLLEIAARSDAAAVFRFAATCRLLRREIQSPAFVRRVCDDDGRGDGVLSCRLLLGFLNDSRAFRFSLVHPRTPAAVSFARDSLAPVVSRGGGLLQQYLPLTSRGGLVLLQRCYSYALKSFRSNLPDMCVYDPMTNGLAFLSYPPDMGPPDCPDRAYALLTADDGVGCSYLVVALQCFILQAISSDAAGGQWGPAARAKVPGLPQRSLVVRPQDGAVVLGGVVHWLVVMGTTGYAVFNYDAARDKTVGAIKLPQDVGTTCSGDHPYLGSSPDGKLAAFGTRGFVVYFWVLSEEGSWARHAEVDTAAMLRLLLEPAELRDEDGNAIDEWPNRIKVEAIGDKKSRVVVLRLPGLRRRFARRDDLFVLDMVTRKILRVTSPNELSRTPYEVDLFSRLSTMKTFELP